MMNRDLTFWCDLLLTKKAWYCYNTAPKSSDMTFLKFHARSSTTRIKFGIDIVPISHGNAVKLQCKRPALTKEFGVDKLILKQSVSKYSFRVTIVREHILVRFDAYKNPWYCYNTALKSSDMMNVCRRRL